MPIHLSRIITAIMVAMALTVAALIVIITAARAQDQDTRWLRETLLHECHRKHNCWMYFYGHHYERRYTWWDHYRRYSDAGYYDRGHYDRDWRDRRDYSHYEGGGNYRRDGAYYFSDAREHRLPDCRPWVAATGHEAYSRVKAKEQGEQAWMEEVRAQWGARYMDPREAASLSYECYRSSTGNRDSEKSADLVGKVLEQCRVEAKPCLATKEFAEEDKGAENSRNLRDDDERRGSSLTRPIQELRRKFQERRRFRRQ